MWAWEFAKLNAAWRFVEFAAGPYGASVVVIGTGYAPNNALAASSPQHLGDSYETHPLYRAGLDQMDRMIPWYSFSGSNSVRVTQAIVTTCRAWSRGRRCRTQPPKCRSCSRGTDPGRLHPIVAERVQRGRCMRRERRIRREQDAPP